MLQMKSENVQIKSADFVWVCFPLYSRESSPTSPKHPDCYGVFPLLNATVTLHEHHAFFFTFSSRGLLLVVLIIVCSHMTGGDPTLIHEVVWMYGLMGYFVFPWWNTCMCKRLSVIGTVLLDKNISLTSKSYKYGPNCTLGGFSFDCIIRGKAYQHQ